MTNLHLPHDRVDSYIAQSLAQHLTSNEFQNLTSVFINTYLLGDEEGALLAGAILKQPTVMHLKLKGYPVSGADANLIGLETCKAICSSLETNHSLTKLDVSKNSLSPDAIACFARSLDCCKSLLSLNISGSVIDNKTAADLGRALRYNQSLTALVARRCRMSSDSVLALLKCLEDNRGLGRISLCNSASLSTTSLRKKLVRRVGNNPTLTWLEISQHQFSTNSPEYNHLENILLQNRRQREVCAVIKSLAVQRRLKDSSHSEGICLYAGFSLPHSVLGSRDSHTTHTAGEREKEQRSRTVRRVRET